MLQLPPDTHSDLDSLMTRLKALDKGASSELSATMIRGLNKRISALEFLSDKEDQNREKLRQLVDERLVKVESRMEAQQPTNLQESVLAIQESIKTITNGIKEVKHVSSLHESSLSEIAASIIPAEVLEEMVIKHLIKAVSEAEVRLLEARMSDSQQIEQLKSKFEASEKDRIDLESKLATLLSRVEEESKLAAEERKIQAKRKVEAEAEAEKALKRERDRASAVVEVMDRMDALEAIVEVLKKQPKVREAPEEAPNEKKKEIEPCKAEDDEGEEEEPKGLPLAEPLKFEEISAITADTSKFERVEDRLERLEKQINELASLTPLAAPDVLQVAALTTLEVKEGPEKLTERIEALALQLEEAKKVWSLEQTKHQSHLPTSIPSTGHSTEFAIQNLTAHIHAVETRLEKVEKGVHDEGVKPERKVITSHSVSRLSRHQRPADVDLTEQITEIVESKVKAIEEILKQPAERAEDSVDKKMLEALRLEVLGQVSKLQEETARTLTNTYSQMTAVEQGLTVAIDELQQRLTSVLTVLVQRVKTLEGFERPPSPSPSSIQFARQSSGQADASDNAQPRPGSTSGRSPLGKIIY